MEDGMIRIGVAGWDYPDWKGTVYPQAAERGFDRLAYISRYVDVVEINSSFYRPVSPRIASTWVERTSGRSDFSFTAKSHRSWTHEPAADLKRSIHDTLEGLRPLRRAGRLGALLVQFPQSFHHRPESLERIERLLEGTEDWPIVAELRHSSWESDEAVKWFERRQAGWCVVDQPAVGRSTARATPRVTSPIGYLRLHGRNTKDWFRKDAGRDARYDYLYTAAELDELAASARGMAEEARELFIIQNNHFRGKALVNALQMKSILEQRPPVAPEELVIAYPELESQVTVKRTRLF
jgi:uncharacterized protein YecE (DUF72 family)